MSILDDDCYAVRAVDSRVTTVLDIGAAEGAFSVLARCLYPRARIVAVEADRGRAQTLVQRLSPLGIDVLIAAVADGRRCRLVPRGDCSYAVYDEGGQPTYTPGQLLQRLSIQPSETLLKVDTEGCESCLSAAELSSFAQFRVELHADHSCSSYVRSYQEWQSIVHQIAGSPAHWAEIQPPRRLTIRCQLPTGVVDVIQLTNSNVIGGLHLEGGTHDNT